MIPFSCPRTCPQFEPMVNGEYWCRFNPLFRALGSVDVHSHTALIKCEYDDPAVLKLAVERMGGVWYGWAKEHDLYDTKQCGWGFRFAMENGFHEENGKKYCYHPVVLRESDGQLAFDSYGNTWMDEKDLVKLKSEYVFAKAEHAAQQLGWLTERVNGELVIYHPQSGQIKIAANGQLETSGFVGGQCHQARQELGLAVDPNSVVETSEACKIAAVVQMPT